MTFEEFQATGRDHEDLGLFSALALGKGRMQDHPDFDPTVEGPHYKVQP